jgi:hypothetical protein
VYSAVAGCVSILGIDFIFRRSGATASSAGEADEKLIGNEVRPRRPRLARQTSGPGFRDKLGKKRRHLLEGDLALYPTKGAPKQQCTPSRKRRDGYPGV